MMDRAEAIKVLVGAEVVVLNRPGDLFGEAYDMAIAALREQGKSQWISVKEPPEPFVAVQCYCPNKDYGSTKIVVSYNEVRNGPAYFADQHWCGEVTHWMPLPEPPEGGA